MTKVEEDTMKREQFEEILKADGWEIDRFGHYHKTVRRRKYRVKLQDRSFRIEVQVRHEATEYSPAKNEWVRLGGDYYSKIVQLDDGRVRVGSYFFGRRE